MSTDLNGLGLLLDDKVPIPVIESSMEPGFLGMITEGLTRAGFNKAPESMGSLDAAKALQDIKTAGQVRLHVLCDFHPYLKDKDDLIDIRWPCSNRAIHETNSWSVVMEEKNRPLRQRTIDRSVYDHK